MVILLLIFYGLFFELSNPGAVVPGGIGGIFIIMAFFRFQTLPINWAGFALIIFALILFALEIKITSFGVLTIGGVISMILGSIMLIDSPIPALQISLSVIIPAVIFTAGFIIFAMWLYYKAQLRKPHTGEEGLVGEVGKAKSKISGEGEVWVQGELWRATSDEPIKKGDKVRVISVDGLMKKVEKTI